MRKEEYELKEPEEFDQIMKNGEVGYLGICDSDGFPRVVPLNYVSRDRIIYFHGASEGEKFTVFKSNPKVTFNVNIPYSIIPSYWLDADRACPVTIFYKSVHVSGYGRIAEDVEEKAMALELLMNKYQPEGGYKPITTRDTLYTKILEKTAVFRIKPLYTTIKAYLGQNLSISTRQDLIRRLEERNRGTDQRTAEIIRGTLLNK